MSMLDLSRTDLRILTSNDIESIQLEKVKALENKNRQMKTGYIMLGTVLILGFIAAMYYAAKRRKENDYPYSLYSL